MITKEDVLELGFYSTAIEYVVMEINKQGAYLYGINNTLIFVEGVSKDDVEDIEFDRLHSNGKKLIKHHIDSFEVDKQKLLIKVPKEDL